MRTLHQTARGTRALLVASAAVALMGCTTQGSFGPNAPTYGDPAKIAQRAADLTGYIHGDTAAYVETGYYESFNACGVYFDDLIKMQNIAQYSNEVTMAGGVAATTLISLRTNAQTAARVLGKWAAGFAFGSAVISKYNERALMTPYAAETKGLILSAMTVYEQANPASVATSPAQAASLVSGYAEMCTYSGITRFAKQALGNAKPKTDDQAPSTADQSYVTAISLALGLPDVPLTLHQVALLSYYINAKAPDPADDKATKDYGDHVEALMAELPTAVSALFAGDKPNTFKKADAVTAAMGAAKLIENFMAHSPDAKAELAKVAEAFAKPVVTPPPATADQGKGDKAKAKADAGKGGAKPMVAAVAPDGIPAAAHVTPKLAMPMTAGPTRARVTVHF